MAPGGTGGGWMGSVLGGGAVMVVLGGRRLDHRDCHDVAPHCDGAGRGGMSGQRELSMDRQSVNLFPVVKLTKKTNFLTHGVNGRSSAIGGVSISGRPASCRSRGASVVRRGLDRQALKKIQCRSEQRRCRSEEHRNKKDDGGVFHELANHKIVRPEKTLV